MGLFSDGEICNSAREKKVNYRSMGKGSGGVAMTAKKKSWRDPDYVTQPSIPGKFETTLYRGNNEDKGFGSQAPRFGQEQRAEGAGPATHGPLAGMADKVVEAKAVGTRGHGAFASRTPRQKAAHGTIKAPGPGAYAGSTGIESVLSAPANMLPSAAFVPPSAVNPAKFNERAKPGPGDYSGAVGLTDVRYKPESTGAFLSCEHRAGIPVHDKAPGPGAYEGRGMLRGEEPASGRAPSPSRRVAGELCPLAKCPKGWDPETGTTVNALAHRSVKILEPEARQQIPRPGPGHYQPKPELLTGGGKTEHHTGETTQFRVGNSHKARKWKEMIPGPGQYEATPGADAFAAANSFDSMTLRFKDKDPRHSAPGPSYYCPKSGIGPESDFHLNPGEAWV